MHFKLGSLYIDSPIWIKKTKATINLKNDDHRCFQYVTAIVFDYEELGKSPQRLIKLYPFTTEYNWYGINIS